MKSVSQDTLDAILRNRKDQADDIGTNQPPTSRATPKKLCIFCDGNHYASACPNYTTLRAGSARAEQRIKCTRWSFDKDHLATACKSKSVCYYCNCYYWVWSPPYGDLPSPIYNVGENKAGKRKAIQDFHKKPCPLLVVLVLRRTLLKW